MVPVAAVAPHVFVSAASPRDATALTAALAVLGVNVWSGGELRESGDVLEERAEAVEAAGVVVLALAPEFATEQLPRKEASYALKQGKRVVPVLVRGDLAAAPGWMGGDVALATAPLDGRGPLATAAVARYLARVALGEPAPRFQPLPLPLRGPSVVVSSAEEADAEPIAAALLAAGAAPWVAAAHRSEAEGDVLERTAEAIEGAQAFVAVLTPDCDAAMQRETAYAKRIDKRVLVVTPYPNLLRVAPALVDVAGLSPIVETLTPAATAAAVRAVVAALGGLGSSELGRVVVAAEVVRGGR